MPACLWDSSLTSPDIVFSGGNLTVAVRNTKSARGTVGYNDVKRHFEVRYNSNVGAPQVAFVGVALVGFSYTTYLGHFIDSWGYYEGDGKVYNNNVGGAVIGPFPGIGSVIGVVFDPAAGTLELYNNGVLIGTYTNANLIGAQVYPAWSCGSTSGNSVSGTLHAANASMIYSYPGIAWDASVGGAGAANFFSGS